MLLPQERLAFKIFYEAWFLGYEPMLKKNIEAMIGDCNLKYRNGMAYNDLLRAIGNVCAGRKTNMDDILDRGAEALDQVLTIKFYGR